MNHSDVRKEQFDLKNNNPKWRVAKSDLTYIYICKTKKKLFEINMKTYLNYFILCNLDITQVVQTKVSLK